jgi:hypothetical protein
MSELDPIEAAMRLEPAMALRRRAARQATIVADGKTPGERGVTIMTGEAILAARLASVLSELAAEFEGEAA